MQAIRLVHIEGVAVYCRLAPDGREVEFLGAASLRPDGSEDVRAVTPALAAQLEARVTRMTCNRGGSAR